MTVQTTYSQARANLAKLLDQVSSDREIVVIHRRKGEDVALVAADELSSLLETAHLLRSPANARRLLAALTRVSDQTIPSPTLDDLYHQVEHEPAQAEQIKAQNELLRQMLRTVPPDDKGPEWWDDFERELRENRLRFRDRELEFD